MTVYGSRSSIAAMSSQPVCKRVLLRGFITACQVKMRSRSYRKTGSKMTYAMSFAACVLASSGLRVSGS